jgi:muramidase (phage lysozyme)
VAFNTAPNAPQPEGIPNFLGASQGTGPDRTFETLFEGVGKTINAAVDMKDKQNISQIEQEASQGFEQLNEEFGLGVPAGVTDFAEKAKALQSAYEQGKLSYVNYYGRMTAQAKAMRQRYPGYEKEVDQAIQSATGTRPANAYRDAILQEMNAAQSEASDLEKERRNWTKTNEAELSILYGDEYFKDPSKFPNAQADVAGLKAERETITAEKAKLDLAAAQGNFNETQATKIASQEADLIVTASLNRALGVNNPDFAKTAQALIAAGGGSPQQVDEFSMQITQAEATLRAELYTQLRSRYGGHLKGEAMNKIIEDALYPVLSIKEAVLGGDYKLAGRLADLNKAMKDQQVNEMMKNSEVLAGVGLNEVSQLLGDNYFNQNLQGFNTIALDVAGRVLAGDAGAVGKAIDQGNNQVSRELVNQSFKMMVDPNLQGEKFSYLMNEFFGEDGNQKNFMDSKVTAAEDMGTLYRLFLNPQMTQAVVTKGTPDDLRKYTEWALEKAAAVPELRRAAGDVNNIARYFPELGLQINPQTGTIIFDSSVNANPDAGRAYREIGEINKVLTVLKPIWDANGIDPVEGAQKLFQSLSIELGSKFFEQLGTSIQGAAGEDEIKGSTGSDTLEEPDVSTIDFVENMAREEVETKGRRTTPSTVADENDRNVLDMIGQAEGAGYDTLFGHSERKYGVVPTEMTLGEVLQLQRRMGNELGSSAFGKYQIIRKTMLGIIDQMGLDLNEQFTPELQDAMALHLLEGRGYSRYKAGKMSGPAFLNELAKEWASVPNASGRSAYHGDKMGNKASGAGKKLASQFA